MPFDPVTIWLIKQGGGVLFSLAHQYLSNSMGLGPLTSPGARSLLDEYIQRLEAKIDEDRIGRLYGALRQLQDALKTRIAKKELLIHAIDSFQVLAQLPEQGMTGKYTNAYLTCLAYLGMAASYIALDDKPELIAEKMIGAVYADSNAAKQALGENVVRQILAKYPKPVTKSFQQTQASSSVQPSRSIHSSQPQTTISSMGTILLTYTTMRGKVNNIAWSPDGKRIAAAGADKIVQILDATTGQTLISHRHSNAVNTVIWSPDGKRVASGSADKTIHVWDAATEQTLLTYQGHSNTVLHAVWSPDGKYIASGSSDRTVQVWYAATGQVLLNSRDYSHLKHAIAPQAWSPNSKYIVSTGSQINIWEPASGRNVLTFRQKAEVASWSPDGNYIAAGGRDKTVEIWDFTTGKAVFTYRGHTNEVKGLVWSPDGKRIASVSTDKTVQVWEALTGRLPFIHRPPPRITYEEKSIKWSPNSNRIALGGADSMWGRGRVVIIQM